MLEELKSSIDWHDDFPSPGVRFCDLNPLLYDPNKREKVINALEKRALEVSPDLLVGVDARGFLWGAMLAQRMHLPIVLARKKGKLGGSIDIFKTVNEYAEEHFAMQRKYSVEGKNVLIVDDVYATGGTMRGIADYVIGKNAKSCYGIAICDVGIAPRPDNVIALITVS